MEIREVKQVACTFGQHNKRVAMDKAFPAFFTRNEHPFLDN